jgi:iron complex outermembrane receptor protein
VAATWLAEIPAVVAQDTGREMLPLEEVIVTARRREESAQDVPIAVTALDEEFLREQNITQIDELGIHIPSFRVSYGGTGTNDPVLTLRGQRPSTVTVTEDPAVPLYFAEVVITPTMGSNLSMYDLANVQVLKGPQGTLFGRNSTGGALLLTPRTPGDELAGHLEARVGNYDLIHLEGAVDLPVSDTLRFRLAGRKLERDGYQSNVADNDLREDDLYWDEDSYGLRVVMDWTPNERLSNLTTVAYDDLDTYSRIAEIQVYNSSAQLAALYNLVHNGGFAALGGPADPAIDEAVARQNRRDWQDIEADLLATETIETWFLANVTEFDLSDTLTIKNIFGYRDMDRDGTADADGTAVPLFGGRTSLTEYTTRKTPMGEVTGEQYSDELQLLGSSFDGRLEWIAGLYWMKIDGSESYPLQISGANPDWPAGGVGVPPVDIVATQGFYQNSPNADAKNEAYAVFGEGTWTFNPRWSFTLGLRQTWDDREITAKNEAFNTDTLVYGCAMLDKDNQPLPDDACSRTESETFDAFTWRTSLNWSPTDDMLLYGSVATGYRTGGFNARGVNNFSLQPYDEETVLTYEIGHKTDWQLGNLAMLRTNLAVYFQDYDDIQKTVDGVNPATDNYETYVVNAAKAEIKGVEFDVTVAPTANLAINLGYAYVDAKYNEWDRDVPGFPEPLDYSRAPFVYIPEHSLTGSASYTLPLDAAVGEVTLMASAYWQDEMDTNDDPWLWPDLGWAEDDLENVLKTTVIDDYWVWNFRIDWYGVMGSNFDIAAYVNNAFDEDYVTGGLSVPESLGIVANTYGTPQLYGASLRWRF